MNFSSRWYYTLGKALVHSTPSLRHFPNIAFETVPMSVCLMMAFSHPFNKDCWVLTLSMPFSSRQSMLWCPWLCAHTGSVSSSSTLQAFHDGSHLWLLLCPPVYLHSRFWWLQLVQGSRSAWIFEGGSQAVEHWHMPIWASHSTFCIMLKASVRMTAWCWNLAGPWILACKGLHDPSIFVCFCFVKFLLLLFVCSAPVFCSVATL